MHTYYQKHKTIQGFQFDGTWQNLKRELPSDIFNALLDFYFDIITNYPDIIRDEVTLEYNRNHMITKLAIAEPRYWTVHKSRIKHANKHTGKWEIKNDILTPGDYVTLETWITNHKIVKSPVENIMRIIPKRHFEAHWSKTPIQPLDTN